MHWSWMSGFSLAAVAVVGFFSLRYIIRFGAQVKRNRAAGMYDDPEFKRQIRPLNVLRYGLVGAQLLVLVVLITALGFGLSPQTMFYIGVIFVVASSIPALVVEHRWRRLMTKGIEKAPKAES